MSTASNIQLANKKITLILSLLLLRFKVLSAKSKTFKNVSSYQDLALKQIIERQFNQFPQTKAMGKQWDSVCADSVSILQATLLLSSYNPTVQRRIDGRAWLPFESGFSPDAFLGRFSSPSSPLAF